MRKKDERPPSMSLDPSQMSPEALMATLWANVRDLKEDVEELRDGQKWLLRLAVGCLITALGGLATALMHLAGAYITMMQHVKP